MAWNDNDGGWGKGLNSGFTSRLLKRLEDEEEQKQQQQLIEQQQQAAAQKAEDDKPWWAKATEAVGDFTEESNKAFMGSVVGGVADAATWATGKIGGFTDEEIESAQKDVRESVGDVDEKGLTNLEKYQGNIVEDIGKKVTGQKVSKDSFMTDEEEDAEVIENQTEAASVAGNIAGTTQKVAADIATTVLPGMAAEKALRATRVAQGLLKGSKGSKIAAETGLSVAGGVGATAAGAVKGPESLTGENVATNVGIDAALGAAIPVLGIGFRAVRNAKNSDELKNILKNSESLDLTDEGRKQLDTLASSGLSGKKFKAQADEVIQQAAIKTDENVSGLVNDIENPLAGFDDAAIRQQIDEFQGGTGRKTPEDYQGYQQLKDELSKRERTSYFANGGRSVEEVQKAMDDLDAGNVPETAMKQANPVQSVDEILERQDIPVEIKGAAEEVAQDKSMIDEQMEGLMSPQVKEQEVARLDEVYQMQLDDLQRKYASKLEQPTKAKDTTTGQTTDGQRLSGEYKSDIRFSLAKEKLDNDYRDSIAELDMLEAQDAEEVAKFSGMLYTIAQREQNILLDTRDLMRAAPDQFNDVDELEVAAMRDKLSAEFEQAKRFTEPENIVTETATSPNPVKSFDSNPDAPDAYKQQVAKQVDELENTSAVKENFKHIEGIKLSALRLMSPSQVLEKMGLRGKDLDIHSDILKAESKVNLKNREDSDVLTRIASLLPNNKNAQKQIVDYLEGNRQTLDLGDRKAAEEIKGWLDAKKAGLEEMGFKTLDDYFPHMFDVKDPEVARLFKTKANAEIKFGNLKQRLSGREDYSRDIMDVLTQYASSYNRKAFLEPALKPLDDLVKQVDLAKAEGEWVDGYIKQLKGFDESKLGDNYNQFMDGVMEKLGKTSSVGQDHYTAHLGTQRMISAVATMGLNPGTAIRNTTQLINTVANIGPRYSTIGSIDGLRLLASKAGRDELQRVGIMEGGVSQNYFDAITKPGIRGRAVRGRDNAVRGMMIMIRGTDVSLRAQAYAGAKALAKSKGLDGKAAEDFAIRRVVDTQFITSRVDMPLAFNGQGVRSFTQLATFSGKQAGFLKRTGVNMVKDADGNFHMDPKQMGSVMSAVIGAALVTEALKPLMGFRETEWVPFYDQIAPFIENTPLGTALEDAGIPVSGGDSLYRSPLVRLLAGDGKSKSGLIQAFQTGDVGEFVNDNWSQIIPAGTQIKKTVEGIQTTTSGESRNASGKLRYLQDMDIDSTLKAAIFGQYATEAGGDWISEGFPTLSESQTANVDQQPTRDLKEQYVDFYQARKQAPGRQKAYAAIKEAALLGDSNKASRLAQEYNQTVTDAMSSYWESHQKMPEELRDEMLGSLYINVGNVIENIQEE